MESPLPHESELERLQSLNRYGLLDTLAEEAFDRIVAIAAQVFETPISLFTLIDHDRQWFKSRVGLDVEETDRTISFCGHAVAASDFLLVEDAHDDARFADNPLVTGHPYIRFYAGAPVCSADNFPLGTLCVIDSKPRKFTRKNRLLLESLGREIESQLEIRRISRARRRLVEERAVLINMIAHDAKNVFTALDWSIDAFKMDHGKDVQQLKIFDDSIDILRKLCQSMTRINNHESNDLEAIPAEVPLQRWLRLTAARATTATGRARMTLETNFDVPDRMFVTDTDLLDRIIGNLYINAIMACSAGKRILIGAQLNSDGDLIVTCEDDGPGIPEGNEALIFEPFFSEHADGTRGDGLGLSICRMAAAALGGTIQYQPASPNGAKFTVRIPEMSNSHA